MWGDCLRTVAWAMSAISIDPSRSSCSSSRTLKMIEKAEGIGIGLVGAMRRAFCGPPDTLQRSISVPRSCSALGCGLKRAAKVAEKKIASNEATGQGLGYTGRAEYRIHVENNDQCSKPPNLTHIRSNNRTNSTLQT